MDYGFFDYKYNIDYNGEDYFGVMHLVYVLICLVGIPLLTCLLRKKNKEIIDKINPEGKVVYSTTNFHVFRSGLYARRVKMRAVGIGARTKWYFWPNATVREFVGLVSAHRLKQAVILGIMILVYILLVFVNYLTY